MSNQATPAVRTPEQVPSRTAAPGVTVREMLGDADGCRGLHQRRLSLADGTVIAGTAGGRGEAWYVIRGSGTLDTDGHGTADLAPGTAVWMRDGVGYECRTGAAGLEAVAVAVQASSEGDDGRPGVRVVTLDACEAERTGDREFRVLLSEGMAFTQFAGLIPPGRAPEHHHTYDEVVHVLAGRGVVHLGERVAEIGPGTSIYLPPYQPHCLENTGQDVLAVLGVFYPAGSPAAKHEA
ncbi:MAG: cupin domain-containing protein [Streptosporangiaceae bacterium]